MRPGDVAAPAVTPHVLEPSSPLYRWPFRPVIALELLPQSAYVWDDADPTILWDDPDPDRLVWDAPLTSPGFTDAVCDFVALELEPGEPDELYLFPPAELTVTLDNRSGTYTPWTADGRLTYWAPGRRVAVWWYRTDDPTDTRWLFNGHVARWQTNPDQTVTVTAFDGLAQLAQPIGGEWQPGVSGQSVPQRFASVAATAQYPGRLDVDAGNVTLSTELGEDSPLEHLQRVALSDGGILYGDADGSVDYRNRLWRAGRADTPTPGWVVSTNVCTVPVVIWDPEAAADDERLATDVRLVNLGGLLAAAAAPSPSPWAGDARYRLTHPDPDLWTLQSEGDALAAYLLAQQGTPAMALNGFVLYPLDPNQPGVAELATGLRRGDRVEVLHGFTDGNGAPQTLDVFGIALAVAQSITPDEWTARVVLSRTVDWRAVELWDETRFVWDDPDPLAVWRY